MTTASAVFPLDKLAMFVRYQTRGAYKAVTGQEAPEFNPSRRPKFWFDPEAAKAAGRYVRYERTIELTDLGKPVVGADGKPRLDMLQLEKSEAATVNIPREGTNIEGADTYEVGMPLMEVPAGHELYFPYGGVVGVKNVRLFAQQVEGFTGADRAALLAIAAKLGV